jgi:hypothetical protein
MFVVAHFVKNNFIKNHKDDQKISGRLSLNCTYDTFIRVIKTTRIVEVLGDERTN